MELAAIVFVLGFFSRNVATEMLTHTNTDRLKAFGIFVLDFFGLF